MSKLITLDNLSAYNAKAEATFAKKATAQTFSALQTFSKGITVSTGQTLKFNKLNIPTTSGGSTYGVGGSGQVLMSNGSNVYWGDLP